MSSRGETNLKKLLNDLSVGQVPGAYVFCVLPEGLQLPEEEIIGQFREVEGRTVIISKKEADRLALSYTAVLAWIRLNVHSSLEAVGLTAAVSGALARAGISCNVVAAYYHDHLFVPLADAERALTALQEGYSNYEDI